MAQCSAKKAKLSPDVHIKEEPDDDPLHITNPEDMIIKEEVEYAEDSKIESQKSEESTSETPDNDVMLQLHNRELARAQFDAEIQRLFSCKRENTIMITKSKYDYLVTLVHHAQNKTDKKTREEYQQLRRFSVIEINGTLRLVNPKESLDVLNQTNIPFYIHEEELFDILYDLHVRLGHGGRDKIVNSIKNVYRNITREIINMFLKTCVTCNGKKRKGSKYTMETNIQSLPLELNSRCQIDLIDMQETSRDGFQFILVYKDHSTHFLQLRALKTKAIKEVTLRISELFGTFGAPCVLQLGNTSGELDLGSVIERLGALWPGTKILQGTQRINDGEYLIQDILDMISSLSLPETNNWVDVLPQVQLTINRVYNSTIKSTPFEAMFGVPVKMGMEGHGGSEDVVTEEEYLRCANKLDDVTRTV